MRISGIPNKYEILQQYYLEENGEQITYDEAMTRYYDLDAEEREDFVKYYNDYCKEYYGDDSVEYEPLDANGYYWRNVTGGEDKYSNLAKIDTRVKYTLEAYAKEKGLILDPQWAQYSAEEIIQMENTGVNIPKEVLEIAHSIYETTGANYISTSTDAEDGATSEKEPFLELVPKAAKKIEKCEENNEKISDAIDELLPEKREREMKLEDKMKEQRKSLEEYEDFIREWNRIQNKINNGEALSDSEARRYAELTGMFEDKKSNSDETDFGIDKRAIADSLSELNIYVSLGEELADETIEIGETLADYTSKTNYKTTKKTVTNEVGFLKSIIAMAKGKTLAEEAGKIGNDTKEYTSGAKNSINDIATVLDIKDQIVSVEPNAQESEAGTGAVQETDPDSTQAQSETKAPGVTEEEDFVINDDTVKQLTGEAADINKDLLSQTVNAVKSIKVAKDDKKFAALANLKVTRLVKEFKEEQAQREQEVETLESENKEYKKEITDLTGESEDEIDKNIQSGDNDSEKYNGMEESDKKTVEQNKQNISSNNQTIADLQEEDTDSKEVFKSRTDKEKSVLDKSIPEEEQKVTDNTEQQTEIIPQAKEDLDFTKNSGITLTRIGKYRWEIGLLQVLSFQFAKGTVNMAKGMISMGIGLAARMIANTPLPKLAEKTTNTAVSNGNDALTSLNNVNGQIVAITGDDTPQGISQGDEDQQQQDENKEKANNKPVTNEANSSESPAQETKTVDNQASTVVEETTTPVSMKEPSTNSPVPVSSLRQANSVENMAASTKKTNATRSDAAVNTSAVNAGSTSSGSGSTSQMPEITKDNARSEAASANKSLGGIKSDTQKGQKETEEITKDEEKSEKQLEKEAKKLEKQMNKEAKEMQKLQKETEKIQKEQLQILAEFEQLTIQNEQLTAEAQAAAVNQASQQEKSQNQQGQGGGLLGSNGFDASKSQNSTVTEKVSSIEYNNQRINELGIKFTANDKTVTRNQKKIKTSQKFIKTTDKRFNKVAKLRDKKANERIKSEEAKQKALQRKLGIVGIFEKVFQAVTAIGTLLTATGFLSGVGAILVKVGVAGSLFCATVKSGIMAANGMIDQAFITLGMSIATTALTVVTMNSGAGTALQQVTAALNVTSSAASLGASVQEFRGKDAGFLNSIATIAGAASAVTGGITAIKDLGKAGTTALTKVSTIAMQSGSLLSTTSQVTNQVRDWAGKEGSSKFADITGLIGMGLTLAGTAGTLTQRAITKHQENSVTETEGTDGKKDSENPKETKGEKGEGEEPEAFQDPNIVNPEELKIAVDDSISNPIVSSEEIAAPTDVQLEQGSELKQLGTMDASTQTENSINEINDRVNNSTDPDKYKLTMDDLKAKGISDILDVKPAKLDTSKIEIPKASLGTKLSQFMDKAQPYMEAIGAAGQLAGNFMTNNDQTDDDTKRKVRPDIKLTKRTQEIIEENIERRKKLKMKYLRRYYA